MDEVLQTNIFFLITGIAVIVVTCVLTVVLYQLIRILTSVRRIVERIEVGSTAIIEDFDHLRMYVTEHSFLSRFFPRTASSDEVVVSPTSVKKSDRKTNKTELKITHED